MTLARVFKTQGRRGEVAAEVHSDVPDRFAAGMELLALGADGDRRPLRLESLWPHKASLVLKFAGVDSISEAEALVGSELQVPAGQRAKLESGWAFIDQLVGSTVFDAGREVGVIQDVRFGAGEAPLLVVKEGAKEYEIPYAEAFLQKADLEHRRIDMLLPEGLLVVNDPLTPEEKQEQQKKRR